MSVLSEGGEDGFGAADVKPAGGLDHQVGDLAVLGDEGEALAAHAEAAADQIEFQAKGAGEGARAVGKHDDLVVHVPQAPTTTAAFTERQAMVSTPFALMASAYCTKPGRCLALQVGVKAPGTAKSATRLPLKRSSVEISCGPEAVAVISFIDAMVSPTWIWGTIGYPSQPRADDPRVFCVTYKRDACLSRAACQHRLHDKQFQTVVLRQSFAAWQAVCLENRVFLSGRADSHRHAEPSRS